MKSFREKQLMNPLNPQQIASMKAMLEARESGLLEKLERDYADDEEFAALRSQHFSESSSDNALVYVLNDLSNETARHDAAELSAVRHALRKFSSGDYGTCESCSSDIGFLRLNAMPEARYCIACQEQSEKQKHFL